MKNFLKILILISLTFNSQISFSQTSANSIFLIKFKETLQKTEIQEFANAHGIDILKIMKYNIVKARQKNIGLAKTVTGTQLSALNNKITEIKQATTVIEIACLDKEATSNGYNTPNDPGFGYQIGLTADFYQAATSETEKVWSHITGSSDVVVAVFDTGIDYTHEDLVDNMWVNPIEIPGNDVDEDNNGYLNDIHGICPVNENGEVMDTEGHGTFVSGIIGAKGNNSKGIVGVAWNIKLMSIKIIFKKDDTARALYSDIIEGIDYAEAHQVKVANFSFGAPGWNDADEILKDRMSRSEIFFVISAGNKDPELSETHDQLNNDVYPIYPANYNLGNTISVGSINSYGFLSEFSRYGFSTVDLAAFGEGVVSTKSSVSNLDFPAVYGLPADKYGYGDGTSFSAPFVTGTAALMLAADGGLVAGSLKGLINGYVDQTTQIGSGVFKTSGKLNTFKAVMSLAKNVTVKNDFGSGTVRINGDLYNSPHIFKALKSEKLTIETEAEQKFSGFDYSFTKWSDNVTVNKRVVQPTESGLNTWTAVFKKGKSILFANEDEVNVILTNTSLNISSHGNVNSGAKANLTPDAYYTIKTNQSTVNRNSVVLKHNKWNANKTEYFLNHGITTASTYNKDAAIFKELKSATITPSLDGVPVTGSVDVKDPWFVETNGTQPANWKTYSNSFTPATMPNGGVFLNEEGGTNKPIYSARLTDSQTILAGTNAYFQNWSGPAGSVASPTSLETAVIFKSANDVIKANYKGHLRTGAPELSDPINQRRVVSDGYNQLMVYESMGEIWLTRQIGETWSPEIRLSFGTGTAKNPSISNLFTTGQPDGNKKAVITWVENNNVYCQPVSIWRYSPEIVDLTWVTTPNTPPIREYMYFTSGIARANSRPVTVLYSPDGVTLSIWYAYEKNNSGIISGYYNVATLYGTSILNGTYRTFKTAGGVSVSTNTGDQYPVLIYQPAAQGFPEKQAIYFLAGGYASGKRIVEYKSNNTTLVFPVSDSEYTFYSLSGGVNSTSASYTLVANAQRNLAGGVVSYDTEIYQKASYYSETSLPSLSKIYSNTSNPVVMVQNTSYIGSPVYEVNFKQGTSWYKANGGASITQIGSNAGGIFAREQVGASDRKSIFVKTNTSPASLVEYSGSGVLNKGECALYADVRSVRNYTTLSGQSKTVILDFAGALVEPVDSLENGSSICAVKLISPDQNTIIVRQPDSIKTALAIDLVRNGVSVRSYSASLWDELSINSFEDVQDGDVLVFRLGFPVASSWGYEIYDFNGTSLTKNGEETADAVKLKKLENGVSVYPNPFNPNTSISVSLEAPASVKVMVFNILGQLVSDFGKADRGAGVHNYAFDGKSLASGTYFYRVEIGEKVKTGKLQLLK